MSPRLTERGSLFAPVDIDVGEMVQSGRPDAFADSPYSEWYENSLRFPDALAQGSIAVAGRVNHRFGYDRNSRPDDFIERAVSGAQVLLGRRRRRFKASHLHSLVPERPGSSTVRRRGGWTDRDNLVTSDDWREW